MNVIVTAGGEIQPGQALYEITHGGRKSMINICGKPMVQRVLDALSQSCAVERVIVVGLPPETDLDCAHELYLLPDHGDVLNNIRAAANEIVRLDPQATHAILASGDLPLMRGEMVDWLLEQSGDLEKDVYYTVIERATMEAAFPNSKRTYVRLKDHQLCGGDLHCFRIQIAVEESPLWKNLIAARKSPLRQASILGYDTLFYLVLRQLSIQGAEEKISQRLAIQGRAVLCPFAEIGMDVDKPFQLEIVREVLCKGHEKHTPTPIKA
jgi:GTP:adenosylcobinamide-phosphate guanylyltransferase